MTGPLLQLLTATPTTGGSFVGQRAEGIDNVRGAAFWGDVQFLEHYSGLQTETIVCCHY